MVNLPLGPMRLWAVPLAAVGVAVVLFAVSELSRFGHGWLLLQYPAFLLLATLLPLIWTRPVYGEHLGLICPEGVWPMIGVTAVGVLLLLGISVIFEQSSPEAAQSTITVLEALRSETKSDMLLLIEVTALGPLAEEAIFRAVLFRVLYDGLRRIMGTETVPLIAALGLSALAFALAHMAPGQEHQQVALFLHGVVLAGLFAFTGSLMAPIIAHSVNNSATAVQLYAMGAFTGAGPEVLIMALTGPFIAITLALRWKHLLD